MEVCTDEIVIENLKMGENTSTESCTSVSVVNEKTISPSAFSYNKTYCRTRFQSIIFEYTWVFDRFVSLYKAMREITSPSFPETGQFQIQMDISHLPTDWLKDKIRFSLLSETEFSGICNIFVIHPTEFYKILHESYSGTMSNMTLLCETTVEDLFAEEHFEDGITFHFEFEIFHQIKDSIMHMNIPPLTENITAFSEDTNSTNLTNDESMLDDTKVITFVISGQHYNVSKKILLSTNSSYFKNLCNTCYKNIGNIKVTVMPDIFKEMLSFIISGILPGPFTYNKFQDLLMMSQKFDVPALKATCEQRLLHIITTENAIEMMQLAICCDAKCLEKHIASFMKFHRKEIILTKEFQLLPQKYLKKILILMAKSEIYTRTTQFCP